MIRSLRPWIYLMGATLALCLAEVPMLGAPPGPTPGPTPRQIYEAQCSFCHQPKTVKALPDLKAWVRLLYTSGCPEVTVKLAETQRTALKAYFEAELKPKPAVPPSPKPSAKPSARPSARPR